MIRSHRYDFELPGANAKISRRFGEEVVQRFNAMQDIVRAAP